MHERDIQKAILNGLHLMGISAYRMNSGTFVNKETNTWIQGHAPGTPDIMCEYKSGDHYLIGWIEVKVPKGKLSWVQIKFLKEAHSKGIPWLVATSWDDVTRWLKEPLYHGVDKQISAVLDPNYVHEYRTPRSSLDRPNPYQGLIDERNRRAKEQELLRGEPPF